jgi:V8-like Glu-specific endopeptidase
VSPSQKQGTVGPDQKQPIGQAPANVKAWAPSVARLTIMTPLGGAYCTGFLLDDTLMMTNEHCIHDKDEALSTIAEFGYDTLSSHPDVVRVKELLAVDPGLDFAIVRLEKKPPSKYGSVTLEMQSGVLDKAALVVIQHPQGQPKMVSLTECNVHGIDLVGVGNEKTDFGHICDTLPGSSGSPVFALSSGRVVGLHHLGYPEGSVDPTNQGVRFAEILKELKAQHAPIAAELHVP